jgi:O-antigen/teichoic acid export membrane protein
MAAADGEGRELGRLVAGSQLVAYMQFAMAPPLLLWSTPIATLVLGDTFERSGHVLLAFTPYVVLIGFGMLFSVTANYLGQARARVPIALTTAAINVVVDLILIPIVGVVGGAIGTDVAYAFYAPAHVWVCRRSAGFPIRPLLLACVRAAFAAAAMGGGMVLAVGTTPGAAGMVAGLAAGLPLFVLVVVVTGGGAVLGRLFGEDTDPPAVG